MRTHAGKCVQIPASFICNEQRADSERRASVCSGDTSALSLGSVPLIFDLRINR